MLYFCSCLQGQHIHKRIKNWVILYKCANCEKTYSGFYNTVFYRSKISLNKWCILMLNFCNSTPNLSISSLWKNLDLNYKTVQHMLKKVQELIKEGMNIEDFIRDSIKREEYFNR